jgi:hypothetical protein
MIGFQKDRREAVFLIQYPAGLNRLAVAGEQWSAYSIGRNAFE